MDMFVIATMISSHLLRLGAGPVAKWSKAHALPALVPIPAWAYERVTSYRVKQWFLQGTQITPRPPPPPPPPPPLTTGLSGGNT